MCTLNICIDIDGVITKPSQKNNKESDFSFYSKAEIREKADEIINILFKFHNIFMVTERDKSLELLTNQYLIYHKILCNKVIVLDNEDKVSIAKQRNCDIFIEDCYETAIELAKNNIKVLLIDSDNNKSQVKNIIRVSNWKQIYKVILNYAMKKEEVI